MKYSSLYLLLLVPLAAWAQPDAATSCVACHGDGEIFEPEQVRIVEDFSAGVHAEVGLSCHDCHGGDPDLELAEDVEAMNEDFEPSPYVGAPGSEAIPDFCGRCHSDPAYIKRFHPGARTDQEQLYWTSRHGVALVGGDTNVATCVDCHGAHGIRRPEDPDSKVYPTRVGETCGRCHSDADRMASYTLPHGQPMPVDQYALWRHSVHARSMFERENLSAPTCNDCHGNHGAAPPGLDSVAFVCGQCHRREAELFRKSPKQAGFADHNEYLADAGAEGCAACHEPSELGPGATVVHGFNECATCHGNHGILRPTVAFLSPLPETPCEFCHEASGQGIAVPDVTQAHFENVRTALLSSAGDMGLSGDERFDWLIGQALALPFHLSPAMDDRESGPRPEFARFFQKFRLGRTVEVFDDPMTGHQVSVSTMRCEDCHAGELELSGAGTSDSMIDRMRRLTALTASAERLMLAARRGGVEVRGGLAAIDRAVDSQIQLETLVHGFSVAEDSPFVAKYKEGIGHAQAAIEAGQSALDELAFRRKGLAVALVVILMVLVALALKIRQLG